MKFDRPAGPNPTDRLRIIGQPADRIDGPLKTAGLAPYAYEWHDAVAEVAYGYVLGAGIARGTIANIDTAEAAAMPGVLAIVTGETAGPLGKPMARTANMLAAGEVEHFDQAVALVVAESLEQARAAAQRIRVDYVEAPGAYDLAAARAEAVRHDQPGAIVGDFAAAFASAPVAIDATYTTPDHAHAMMEPHATMAAWEGDKLTLWTSIQTVGWSVRSIAGVLGIAAEHVRIVSPYCGGGFGSKLWINADGVLAALGARVAGRPVKVALTRPLLTNNTTHRPATIQRVRLGAEADGRITAIAHESWSGNLPGGSTEKAAEQTRWLYAAPNRLVANHLARLDLPEGHAMRAPGEAPGMMALEIAIDELAEKLGMDPVALRIRNDTQVDPENPQRPFSRRDLIGCLQTGAARFGWGRRTAPAARREGDWLVGMGVAAAYRGNILVRSAARVEVLPGGGIAVTTDMTDIGTGSYTIIAQTAAEMMGVPLAMVRVELGDSRFPMSPGSGGQFGANCATAGVYAACMKLREEAALRLGFNAGEADFEDGMVRAGGRAVPLAQAAGLAAQDMIEFGDLAKATLQSTFGAHFVEAAVDVYTGEIRIRRMLAVCAAGRILNPKTARSQVIGAMVMGVGAAIMEELAVDKARGFFVNHDLAGYEIPVHADIPEQEVIFLDEVDELSSPMKAKGVGELGLCGVSAAVANAIYNATGVRLRDYPITLDRLLAGLPAVA